LPPTGKAIECDEDKRINKSDSPESNSLVAELYKVTLPPVKLDDLLYDVFYRFDKPTITECPQHVACRSLDLDHYAAKVARRG